MTRYINKSSYKKLKLKIFILLFLSLGFLIYAYSSRRPDWTEQKYSRGVYPKIISFWANITSGVRFSIAELIVYALVLAVIIRIVRGVIAVINERTASGRVFQLVDLLLSGVAAAVAICFLFISLWGLNYNRLSFSESSGLNVAPAPVGVLERCSLLLATQANELREEVREDDEGVMALSVPLKNTFDRSREGYRITASEFETLGDIGPGRAKPVLASRIMSYAGITGVYFPITAEANVNTDINAVEIPFTICHELAHQKGYAREDEANFIAWLACMNSPFEDYRYSGALNALCRLLNALNSSSPPAWERVRSACSPAVNRDLNAMGQYWKQYEGPVSDFSESINDTFLKANGQEDGVQSYGRMVDLVIAYYHSYGLAAG